MSKAYKSIYFSDYNVGNKKSLTLAFSEPERPVYNKIKDLSSAELKELIGVKTYKQLALFAEKDSRSLNNYTKTLLKAKLALNDSSQNGTSGDVTFKSSKSIPFQRWYPYVEGYSLEFVDSLIKKYNIKGDIFEPFAGTGSTIFSCDHKNLSVKYCEVNPMMQFIVKTKLRILSLSRSRRKLLSDNLLLWSESIVDDLERFDKDKPLRIALKAITSKRSYFPKKAENQLLKIRTLIDAVSSEDKDLGDLLEISVMGIILKISNLKKVGDVRFKNDKEINKGIPTLEELLPAKIRDIASDLINFEYTLNRNHQLIFSNAKAISKTRSITFDNVITSPPYLNGTNYLRNTKLELWFHRSIQSGKDLRGLRDEILTSGINDVNSKSDKGSLEIVKHSKILEATIQDLKVKTYDQRIPKMALAYFTEMNMIFEGITRALSNEGKLLIDIGDSIFAGVHIKTDEILIELANHHGLGLYDQVLLRKRRSRNKQLLVQTLLVFTKAESKNSEKPELGNKKWNSIKNELPYQNYPYSKRNWGHPNHSLCSYQGKLKPSIAYHLIDTFVPQDGLVFDPFSGSGTIPFEAALAGKLSYGMDISKPAVHISRGKTSKFEENDIFKVISDLQEFILGYRPTKEVLEAVNDFGFNKKIVEYYHPNTFNQLLAARRYFNDKTSFSRAESLVFGCLLHILHGNRPYALSRRSHPIVPYAPSGEFEDKDLVSKLRNKVERVVNNTLPEVFVESKIFHQSCTDEWPHEINNLDAIITSPPFYESTRFYNANWIRLWFSGWDKTDFATKTKSFVEEKQRIDLNIYDPIFRQARERLKSGGVLVLHLGKNKKCDMAHELIPYAEKYFNVADVFNESVEHCESHGFKDKGSTVLHQYLVLN